MHRTAPACPLDVLQNLAPQQLVNLRVRRYKGDDFFCAMDEFAEVDRQKIQNLYGILERLLETSKPAGGGSERPSSFYRDFEGTIRTLDLNELIRDVRELGIATLAGNKSDMMSRTLHDIRGGGLTSLLGNLQLAGLGPADAELTNTVFYLTRDHLKIMRNALVGLDDERREEDLKLKLHPASLLVEKWSRASLCAPGQEAVPVQIECRFDGNISECCVEFGALDRVLYNLLNNAARHTDGSPVSMVLFPIPDEAVAAELRIVILNKVPASGREKLHEMTSGSDDLRQLFTPGVSTTGSGLGLAITADLVANAYGLPDRTEALGGRYLGAQLLDDTFAAWVHWPLSRHI